MDKLIIVTLSAPTGGRKTTVMNKLLALIKDVSDLECIDINTENHSFILKYTENINATRRPIH